MDQHPVPRQITTFEFKLIGFLTVKQFIYLVVFIPLGFIVYTVFPIPFLNILLGVVVGAIGAALAFLPVNDRPLDVWIGNLFKRLTSPTQYQYHKQNPAVYFLKNLFFVSDPHRVVAHIQSQELLTKYLAKTQPKTMTNGKKQLIQNLFSTPVNLSKKPSEASPERPRANEVSRGGVEGPPQPKLPFFSGVVKNHKLIPLPGILIYVKDEKGETLRLLKTNPHGVFATFSPLSPAEYIFEIKDPKNTYLFDTMKIKVEAENQKPLEFFSKELI